MSALEEPGGVLFGPPSALGYALKVHLCASCWRLLVGWLGERPEAVEPLPPPSASRVLFAIFATIAAMCITWWLTWTVLD